MNRRTTLATAATALLCFAVGLPASESLAQQRPLKELAPAAVVTQDAPPAPEQHIIAIGCIGFHGTGSGHAVNGRCVTG